MPYKHSLLYKLKFIFNKNELLTYHQIYFFIVSDGNMMLI
jgi:hypothetical protein